MRSQIAVFTLAHLLPTESKELVNHTLTRRWVPPPTPLECVLKLNLHGTNNKVVPDNVYNATDTRVKGPGQGAWALVTASMKADSSLLFMVLLSMSGENNQRRIF